MKKNNLVICLVIIFLLIPLINGLAFEKDTDIILRVPCINDGAPCSGSATCNITVVYPNGSIMVNNQLMTNNGAYHSYSLPDNSTTSWELFRAPVYCIDGSENGDNTITFYITENGKEPPEGITVIFFGIIFIIIIAGMLGLLLYTIFHFINVDLDAWDLIYNFSAYFSLFVVYILALEYLGNAFINSFLLFLIEVGAVTTILIPLIGFVVSFIKIHTVKEDR